MSSARLSSAISSPLFWVALWAVAQTWMIIDCVQSCDGHLVYSLDDPYIHLAVAETILEGGYGVNSGEYSSPASSMVYPLILTITEGIGLGIFGPLIVNVIAAAFSVYFTSRFMIDHVVDPRRDCQTFLAGLFVLTAILLLNPISMPMTGMENICHVLACVLAMKGLVQLNEAGQVTWPLMAGLVAAPLFRFEGIALALSGLGVLIWTRHWRATFLAFILIAAPFGVYEWVMSSLDLPPLPSSVLAKSEIIADTVDQSHHVPRFTAALHRLSDSLSILQFWILIVIGLALLARLRRGDAVVIVPVGLMILAHLVAGRYGWAERYQAYVVVSGFLATFYIYRRELARCFQSPDIVRPTFIVLTMLLVAKDSIGMALLTPQACRSIYDQHGTLSRLVQNYLKAPVAVNDLGMVTYGNDQYVLDLLGLGSERVRRARAAGELSAEYIQQLVTEYRVNYALIYSELFENTIPADWILVGHLHSRPATAAFAEVDLYATRPESASKLRESLVRFRATLPEGVQLKLIREADVPSTDPIPSTPQAPSADS